MAEEIKKLAKAQASVTNLISYPNYKPGYNPETKLEFDYSKIVKESRKYYERDAVAGTVINRMCEIGITTLKNKRKSGRDKKPLSDEVLSYYKIVAEKLNVFLRDCALEYLLHGMAIPDYTLTREMGSKHSDYLGRTRYYFPDELWCRNPDNIQLKKKPNGVGRFVYLRIPAEDITLVRNKGKIQSVGDTDRTAEYTYLITNFPEYVAMIEAGKTMILLDTVNPVFRKLTSYNDYPIPFLMNALAPMAHKQHLKDMDRAIASRAIEAIRQIKVGNDTFPADDDDIESERANLMQNNSSGERVFNYFTNHTVEIKWSYPPLDALLNEHKYTEPNLDIFIALGWPRIWANGETERSNAADNSTASTGPVATLKDMRDHLLAWVKWFYAILAEKNNFSRYPEPYFSPINMADVANLIQYGAEYINNGAISRNTISMLYGSDYDTEAEQREVEVEKEEELAPAVEDPITTGTSPLDKTPNAPEKQKEVEGNPVFEDNKPTDHDGDGQTNE